MGYARKEVEKTKKIAKKFVRYQEGAELYSIRLTKFQEVTKEAKVVYKRKKLIENRDIIVFAKNNGYTICYNSYAYRK